MMQNRLKLVLPQALIEPIVKELHQGYAGAHLGIQKTESKLKQHCWHPGLKRQVIDFIRPCEICQKCKSGKHSKAPLHSIPAGRRNQRVHIDIVGSINPPSRKGNRYILVAQDAFTKWPEAWPIRNQ
jgi:hypothetical protein